MVAEAADLLDDVRRDIARLTGDLAGLRLVEDWLIRRLVNPAAEAAPEPETRRQARWPKPSHGGTTTSKASQTEVAEAVLREVGPCSLADLVDRMLARGFKMSGPTASARRRLSQSLSSILRRRVGRFRRVGGLWEVVEAGQAAGRGG